MIRIVGALTLWLVVTSSSSSADPADAATTDAWVEQSRRLAEQLGEQLKGELMRAMQGGGSSAAIDVCAERAPRIAGDLSAQSGANVSRTALRVRNPANEPDDVDRAALERFVRELAAGPVERPPEAAFTVNREGRIERRYLRAIVTDGLCVTCHGGDIAPDLAAAIERRYPQDRATGFSPGDLRGAFKVVWPAATDD